MAYREDSHNRQSAELFTNNKKPKTKSKFWFTLHHWVGFKLSIFLSFIFITGTLATVSHEIDWLINTNVRASEFHGEQIPLGELVDTAIRTFPEWSAVIAYAPVNPWHSAQLHMRKPNGEYWRVFIDPYSGEVIGDSMYLSAPRFLREVHRNLMLPTNIGIPIVGSLSILMLISLISGLIVYKKFWRGFFKKTNKKNLRVYWGSLHRLAGVWSIWFILIIALTSLWYLAESFGAGAPSYLNYSRVDTSQSTMQPLKSLQQIAQRENPKFKVTHILPPTQNGRPAIFWGNSDAILVRPRANLIAVNPITGYVLQQHDTHKLNFHQQISEMADPLHFGTLGGLSTKIIWFIFGMILSLLSVSGAYIYAKRTAKYYSAEVKVIAHYWRQMNLWGYLGCALVLTAFIAWPFRQY